MPLQILLDDEIREHGRQSRTFVLLSPPMKLPAALRNVSILMCRLCMTLMTVPVLVRFPQMPKATMWVTTLLALVWADVTVVLMVVGSPADVSKNGYRYYIRRLT